MGCAWVEVGVGEGQAHRGVLLCLRFGEFGIWHLGKVVYVHHPNAPSSQRSSVSDPPRGIEASSKQVFLSVLLDVSMPFFCLDPLMPSSHKNSAMRRPNSSGFSICGACPHWSMITSREPRM